MQNSVSHVYQLPPSCLTEYEHKLFYGQRANKRSDANPIESWALRRESHDISFATVKKFVDEKLVDDRQVHSLTNIYQLYTSSFNEELSKRGCKLNHTSYTRQHLCTKLLEAKPILTKTIFKNRTFLHLNDLSLNELCAQSFQAEGDSLLEIKSVAYDIRRKMMSQEKRYLPKHNISVENIYEGECDISIELYTLISSLIKGPRDSKSEKMEIKIKSICDSIIYTMSCGTVKPSTCLSLAFVTKSITGSRRMVEILNRMGHCVSYSVVEELESELAYGCAANTEILPYGLVPKNPILRTHVAFDNYDKFVETSSGKDTLHDTVGIVYQNIVQPVDADTEIVPKLANRHDNIEMGRRRRKYCSTFDSAIMPYIRKTQTLPNFVGKKTVVPESLRMATDLNHLWMIYHAFNIDGAARWFAWNSTRSIDANPMQKIGYLPSLNMSPTSDAVVKKTLETALAIADECSQEYIVVTYDLAIACKAYKIQADQAPDFDRIFITLGSFHIELSFFKVFIHIIFPSSMIYSWNAILIYWK